MSAPLTNGQKSYLAQLSRRAGNLLAAQARGRGEDWTLTDEQFRHEQVIAAVGKDGLRCCGQSDYKLIEAHFLEMLGQHARAFNAQVRAATEERRTVEYKIVAACQEFGFHLSYADTICRRQNKGKGLSDIDDSDEGMKRLWGIFFTIRNRGRSKHEPRTTEHAHS